MIIESNNILMIIFRFVNFYIKNLLKKRRKSNFNLFYLLHLLPPLKFISKIINITLNFEELFELMWDKS